MIPEFTILANQQDVTKIFSDRLLSLRVTDESGTQSDTLEIQLDDRDYRLSWPEHGAALDVVLGGQATEPSRLGVFIVDELSHSGPPATLSIRGKAANMREQFKEHKTRAWNNVTLNTIVETIAAEHTLIAKVSPSLVSIVVEHVDQTDESDLHFLTRIGRDVDAITKPTHGFLVFVTKGESKSVSGQLIPPVHLNVSDLISYRMTHADRGKYQSVRSYWQNTDAAELVEIHVGEGKPTYTLRKPSPTIEQATQKAIAKLNALTRGTATLSLSLVGNPNLRAEGRITVSGIRSPVDGEWVMTRVEHALDSSGFVTRVEAEVPKQR